MSFFDYNAMQRKLPHALPRIDTDSLTVPYIMTQASDYSPPTSTAYPNSDTSSYPAYPASPFYAASPSALSPLNPEFMLKHLNAYTPNSYSPIPNHLYGSLISPYPTSELGPRNFKCEFCEKGYIRSHDLKRHQRQHHFGGERFPCPKCDSLFSRSDALKRHVKNDLCVKKRERRMMKAREKAMRRGWTGEKDENDVGGDGAIYSEQVEYSRADSDMISQQSGLFPREDLFVNSEALYVDTQMVNVFDNQIDLNQPSLQKSLAALVDNLIAADNTPSPLEPSYQGDDEATTPTQSAFPELRAGQSKLYDLFLN